MGLLSGILAFAGCAAKTVDTEALAAGLETIEGANGSFIEVQHPGGPANVEVVVWLFLDSIQVDSVAQAVRDAAGVIQADDAVHGHQVSIAVVKGSPDQYPTRSDITSSAVKIMGRVADELGLPESSAGFLVLTARDVDQLVGSDG